MGSRFVAIGDSIETELSSGAILSIKIETVKQCAFANSLLLKNDGMWKKKKECEK